MSGHTPNAEGKAAGARAFLTRMFSDARGKGAAGPPSPSTLNPPGADNAHTHLKRSATAVPKLQSNHSLTTPEHHEPLRRSSTTHNGGQLELAPSDNMSYGEFLEWEQRCGEQLAVTPMPRIPASPRSASPLMPPHQTAAVKQPILSQAEPDDGDGSDTTSYDDPFAVWENHQRATAQRTASQPVQHQSTAPKPIARAKSSAQMSRSAAPPAFHQPQRPPALNHISTRPAPLPATSSTSSTPLDSYDDLSCFDRVCVRGV